MIVTITLAILALAVLLGLAMIAANPLLGFLVASLAAYFMYCVLDAVLV